MKQLMASLIVGASAAAAFSTAAAAPNATPASANGAPLDVVVAFQSSTEPQPEPQTGPESQPTLQGMPDLVNRPER